MGAYCSKKDQLKLPFTARTQSSHEAEPDFSGFQRKVLDESQVSDQAEVNKVFGFYEEMLQRDPENADWLAKMGFCLYAKGRMEEAEVYFRRAVSKSQDGDAKTYYTLGGICQRKGENEKAKELYQQAAAKDPNLAKVYVRLGELSLEEKDYKAAVSYLQRGCELDAADAEARSGLGTGLLSLGRVQEATEQLEAALSHNPTLAKAHNSLANAYRQQGRLAQAIKHYILAIENTPRSNLHLRKLLSCSFEPCSCLLRCRRPCLWSLPLCGGDA